MRPLASQAEPAKPSLTEPASQGLADVTQPVANLVARLAIALDMETIDPGSEETIAFFEAQIAAHGLESVVADCIEAARRSNNGVPASLSFFPGWFRRLPRAAQGSTL